MVQAESLNSLVGELGADQATRWRQGDRVAVESYLEQHPTLRDDAERALELIYQEVLLREELGEAPQLSEYQMRFPQFASQLQALFEVHRVVTAADPVPLPSSAGTKTQLESTKSRTLSSAPPNSPVVSGYELQAQLGRGGMGVVYQARQVCLDRVVALKLIPPGAHAAPEELARFQVEAEAAARLQHPNIVQVYEVGERDGWPYLALEFVDGGSLAQKLNGTPLPPRQAAELLVQVARAVSYAHERGVVHRRLKPANVLLTSEGMPKIADFGLAKRLDVDTGQTRSGAVLGSPSYMAPEQAEGRSKQVGPQTDVYALGAILYEMLTGRPPFRAATLLDTLEQVRSQEPAPPRLLQPKSPRDLETICLKCLAKEQSGRYASAAELAEDLTRFLNGESIHARSVNLVEQVTRLLNRQQFAFPMGAFHGALYLWLAPLPFLMQLVLFLAAGGQPFYPLASLGVVVLTAILLMGVLLVGQWVRPMGLPANVVRHVWSGRLGLVLGVPALIIVSYLIAPEEKPWDPLHIYPLWVVTAGVCLFPLGSVLWGRLYLLSLSLFAMAALMAWQLHLSPMLLGIAVGAILVVLGLHLRRLAREAAAETD